MGHEANPRYIAALQFAVERHGAARQARKGTDFPYAVHVIRVAEILDRFGCAEDVVVAGFLHDTVEDAGVTYADLEAAFGECVAALVEEASEPDKSLPWRARKGHTIERLRAADLDALSLVAADKLDNVLSLQETLCAEGAEKTWARFNASESEQHWYYRSLVEELLARDPKSPLFRTLDVEVHTVFPDKRRTTRFFPGEPLGNPHDARAYLADPIKHWRPEHSAYELAHSWLGDADVPVEVDRLLVDAFGEYEIVEGFFEKHTRLDDLPRASQTDLLLLLRTADGLAVVGIEAKAREGFDKPVSNRRPNEERLAGLCEHLGLEVADVQDLAYQLLHRTVATLLEAERYGATHALMLVQSFDPADASFDDYCRFAERLGLPGAELDRITGNTELRGVTLRLGWVRTTG